MITFDSAIAWLRAAYPQGVPAENYSALVAVLERAVGRERTERLLEVMGPTPEGAVAVAPTTEQSYAVAAQLAAVGWPLAGPGADEPLREPGYVSRVIDWLRAGYPQGVPPQDYIPVLAVLRPQLDDEELEIIANQLVATAREDNSPVSDQDVHAAILEATDEEATPDELMRVRELLEKQGWPFE